MMHFSKLVGSIPDEFISDEEAARVAWKQIAELRTWLAGHPSVEAGDLVKNFRYVNLFTQKSALSFDEQKAELRRRGFLK
jgi:hypothetical protein